jgi:ABC-type multidrug transport system fused ATPase/permease subunit
MLGFFYAIHFFFFRLSLFIDFTEHTLANLRHSLYSNLVSCLCFLFAKRVGELNSRISSDITQIQDTLTSTIAEF